MVLIVQKKGNKFITNRMKFKDLDKNEWKITKGNIVESSKNLELKEDLFT